MTGTRLCNILNLVHGFFNNYSVYRFFLREREKNEMMKSSFACLSTIQRNNFGSNLTKTSISVKELINANENYELSVVYVVTIFRLLFFFQAFRVGSYLFVLCLVFTMLQVSAFVFEGKLIYIFVD